MYYYELRGWEESYVLMCENEYTQDEFEEICKKSQSPYIYEDGEESYDVIEILEWLKSNYGFINLDDIVSGKFYYND